MNCKFQDANMTKFPADRAEISRRSRSNFPQISQIELADYAERLVAAGEWFGFPDNLF
jgi:hypothetical protein